MIPMRRVDLPCHPLASSLVEIHDGDAGSLLGKGLSDGFSDVPPGASDDGYFVI
jgi:hypothetical protein